MKKPKSIITKVSLFVFLILIGIVLSQFISFKKKGKSKLVKVDTIDKAILSFAQKKAELYEKGDIENLYQKARLNCPDYIAKDLNVSLRFFECNPLFFLCLQQKSENYLGYEFQFLGHEIAEKGRFIVKYLVKGNSFQIKLKNTCRATSLPSGIYNAGPRDDQKYLWDSYNQKVYVDKNYFSNLDMVMAKKGKLKNIKDPHKAVLNLSPLEMKNACAGLGGQLMQNRYFDALANFPSKVSNKVVRKFRYPWTKKRELNENMTISTCLKSYNQGCEKVDYKEYADFSPSWIGTYHTLGSMMEYLENKFYPAANIKVSSKFIPFDSIWNRNFFRGSLKESEEVKEYNGIGREFLEIKDWAFRCIYFN